MLWIIGQAVREIINILYFRGFTLWRHVGLSAWFAGLCPNCQATILFGQRMVMVKRNKDGKYTVMQATCFWRFHKFSLYLWFHRGQDRGKCPKNYVKQRMSPRKRFFSSKHHTSGTYWDDKFTCGTQCGCFWSIDSLFDNKLDEITPKWY